MRAAPLDAGWAALRGGDWKLARASFEESLAEGETSEALEGIGYTGRAATEVIQPEATDNGFLAEALRTLRAHGF